MSEDNNTPPSEFESLDEAREYLSWVSSEIKTSDWSEYGGIVRTYADSLAKSYSEGTLSESDCEECYEAIPVKNYPFNKAHLKEWFDDAVQTHGHPTTPSGTAGWGPSGMPLDIWIEEHLKSLTITEYKDSNMKAKHKWLFEYDEKRAVVETEKHHNSASQFESLIEDNFPLVQVDDPTEPVREGSAWKREFMRPFKRKDDRVKTERVPGPRTKCIEAIKNLLEVRTAYFDINEASKADGVFIDPTEQDWMYVRSTLIAHEATEHGFGNTEPIRTELDFKGVVEGKVSHPKRLSDGQTKRWWKLPRDFADVGTEDEDATPAGEERFSIDGGSGEDYE